MATQIETKLVDESTYNISSLSISEAKPKVDQTPANPIESPPGLGAFDVDPNVIGGV